MMNLNQSGLGVSVWVTLYGERVVRPRKRSRFVGFTGDWSHKWSTNMLCFAGTTVITATHTSHMIP